ncbi:caspase family protein [Roseibium salinum]|nr:caspase family protein [Roseibium salinum]
MLCIVTAATAHASTDPFAERRMALIVGIADYQNAPDLYNTTNDGKLISETLKKLDFEVSEHFDIGLDEFKDLLKRFEFESETADVALVYFAGHGIEVGGTNFLVPADADAASRQRVADTSVSLDDILAAVDKARQLRIVILDSCRNDPFASADGKDTLTLEKCICQEQSGASLAGAGNIGGLCGRGRSDRA